MHDRTDSAAQQGTCFVVMGFGKKTDFETGRVLDLDQSYKNLMKPAVRRTGYNAFARIRLFTPASSMSQCMSSC
jgi:hypothetical protein